MSKLRFTRAPTGNKLLDHLPDDAFLRLQPHLQFVVFEFNHLLYEAGSQLKYAYFPTEGVVSALTVMQDGSAIELATIGKEGMVGLPLLMGIDNAIFKTITQFAGKAIRINSDVMKEEIERNGPFRRLLLRYNAAFLVQLSQGVACNGLHSVQQRCCRWLLMSRDRAQSDVLPLTHEFISLMLGVRRASISEVLHPLQAQGLIRTQRGKITILDLAGLEANSCECYRTVRDLFARMFD